eukprot:366496-Chlamydomonas_euryale.AAC.16
MEHVGDGSGRQVTSSFAFGATGRGEQQSQSVARRSSRPALARLGTHLLAMARRRRPPCCPLPPPPPAARRCPAAAPMTAP